MSHEGSTRKLIQLCFGYWFFYVIAGVVIKYFTAGSNSGFPRMTNLPFSRHNGNINLLGVF